MKVKDGLVYVHEQDRRFKELMAKFQREKDSVLQTVVDETIQKPTSIFT